MAYEAALPSSSRLESDARRIHAAAEGVTPGDIALGVVIGRMAEFFDFFIYAIASVLVFPQVFFTPLKPLDGLLASFSVFALAFLARPVGSVLFTAIDRRHGRGVKLTLALFLLGGSTAGMSFLPGYADLGWTAVVLLGSLRLLQGLALGGAWDGLASLLAVNAPEDRRGWWAMAPQLGAPLGFLLAGGLLAVFSAVLKRSDFLDWGWRYPFFVALAINMVALFARLRLVATEPFGRLFDRGRLRPMPVLEVARAEGPKLVIGAFAPLATFALFHLVTIFPLSWSVVGAPGGGTRVLTAELLGAGFGLVGVVASGKIADRIGRRRHLTLCAILIGAFAMAAPELLARGRAGELAYIVAGWSLLGLSFGQAAGVVSADFSRLYRYTGAALTSELAWLVGAGFAPLAALVLATRLGLPAVGLYLLSGVLCSLLALALSRLQTAD
jgi:MFS family permease